MKRAGTPLGALRIGTAALREGYDVRVIDSPFEGWDQEETLVQVDGGRLIRYGLDDARLRRMIEEYAPDIVGISCLYTCQWGNARALADRVKSISSDIVVVGGGAHCSGDWANALCDSPMDYIVAHEADVTFPELLNALTGQGVPVSGVKGIRYRSGDRLVSTGNRPYMGRSGIAEMPVPGFSLLNMDRYRRPYHSAGARKREHGSWAQIFSSIGCNIRCGFCYIPMVNGPWRAFGLEWFDRHLADIKRHGVTEVLLEDDHLLHDPPFAMEVFKLLKKHDLPWFEEGGLSLFNLLVLLKGEEILTEEDRRSGKFTRAVEARKAGIDAQTLIRAMAESGCYGVYLAVESANEESLLRSNKPVINALQDATEELLMLFRRHGIDVTGGFMLGFMNPPATDGGSPCVETLEQMERTIAYAVRLKGAGMTFANPFIVTPIPGTPLWEYLRPFVVRDYDTGWSHERGTFASKLWGPDRLERMRWKLLREANGEEAVEEMHRRGTWVTGSPLAE